MQMKQCPGPVCDPDLKLKKADPEPRVHLVLTDRPDFDVDNRETNAERYEIHCRPPGVEDFYEVEPQFGGYISADQVKLETYIFINRWREAHLHQLTQIASAKGQTGVPNRDGTYQFVCYAYDSNGFVSEESNVVSLRLDMTKPEPPSIEAKPIPNTIAV